MNATMQSVSPLPTSEPRPMAARRIAAELFQREPDWVLFFREVLGVDGIVRTLYPQPDALALFEKSEEYAEIQGMLARLREKSAHEQAEKETTRVITVRLPKSLHASLRAESHDRKTSMNQLCIDKLLAPVSGG
jgi:predicted HicB family RNase H-like nuclease